MPNLLIPLEVFIPLTLVVVILIFVSWVLYVKNRETFGRMESERKKFSYFKERIKKLESSDLANPTQDFEELNKLCREFFKEYFNLDYHLTYLELKDEFLKQNKKDYAHFCQLMSYLNYTGEKAKSLEIREVIDTFYKIISEY